MKTAVIQTPSGTKACDMCRRQFSVLIDCPTKPEYGRQWGHLCDHCYNECGVQTSVNTMVTIEPTRDSTDAAG